MSARVAAFALLATACGAVTVAPAAKEKPKAMSSTANGSTSPSGDRHPGQIESDDQVAGRKFTQRADEVPQSIAWVAQNGKWVPVIRIEITGNDQMREIKKFGPGGQFLESTILRR